MAKVKMKKLSLIGLQSEREKIINVIHKLGTVEIKDLEFKDDDDVISDYLVKESASKELAEVEADLSKVKYSIDFISKYYPVKKGLFNSKHEITSAQFEDNVRNNKWDEVHSLCRSYDEKLNTNKNEQSKLVALIESLEPWQRFDAPIEMLESFKNIVVQLGVITTKDRKLFQDELSAAVPDSYLEVVTQIKDDYYIAVICNKLELEDAASILKKYNWNKVQFNGAGTPAEYMQTVRRVLDDRIRDYEDIIKKVGNLTDYNLQLQIMYDYLDNEVEKKRVLTSLGRTSNVFMLEGWIPAENIEDLNSSVRKITNTYIAEFEDPKEDDDVPTAVKNNKFVEPYEIITNQYSVPSYKEIDPNPFIAPFYFVFFGMMLGDAGYGALMGIGCWISIRLGKLEGGTLKFFKLLLYGSISSVFWGIMFGSYFGNALPIKPLWFNPIDDPITLLIFSLGLGIVHLFIGLGIKAYELIRDGKVWDAIFDIGFWYMLIVGFLMLILPATAQAGKYVAIAGTAGLVLTQGRSNKNIILRLLSGILSLYGVTGYLGDVLSYSRILALGLASSLIGLVINTMIGMLGGGIVGYVFGALIFIGGHVFNLAIAGLGAYVHTTRLQYLEFFSKFYEGGGKAFKPLKLKTKFINIIEESK